MAMHFSTKHPTCEIQLPTETEFDCEEVSTQMLWVRSHDMQIERITAEGICYWSQKEEEGSIPEPFMQELMSTGYCAHGDFNYLDISSAGWDVPKP